MKKTIISISILAIGIGIYFYLQDTKDLEKPKEVKKVENTIKEEVKKTNIVKAVESKKKKGPEIVKGYKLPPEPDPKINNSTLLGVDSNDNMLRDDVERWIVKQNWSDERIAASLQSMRGFQILIDDSIGTYKKRATLSDIANYVLDAKRNDPMLEESREFRSRIFNTPERKKAYVVFDSSFSGKLLDTIPAYGKYAYKYADYTMENGKLSSYKFNNEMYYSNENIPIYREKDGLIESFWSLKENKRQHFKGNWSDKFCEINFGIPKNNIECGKAKIKYRKDLENGVIR